MLNLLFISDSPKAEYLKRALQPVLKVIIDVVPDFDHGLKDVFEKRPTTVCVQDQIGGVTGESVARHIQMLLGSGAPTFILLHSGAGKARVIKGLYEHIVDLNQSNETLTENITSTLMSLLGDQWDKIYIPPQRTAASVKASMTVPEESRDEADKLVDDFLSDLETTGFKMADDQPPVSPENVAESKENVSTPLFAPPPHTDIQFGSDGSNQIQTTSDELAELLLAEASKAARDDIPASQYSSGSHSHRTDAPKSAPTRVPTPEPFVPEMPALPEDSVQQQHPTVSPAAAPGAKKNVSPSPAPDRSADSPRAKAAPKVAAPVSASPATKLRKPAIAAPPAAAEFRISQNKYPDGESLHGELLQTFEDDYRSQSTFWKRAVVSVLVSICFAVGGWYLFTQKPLLLSSLKQSFSSLSGAKPQPVSVTPVAPVAIPTPAPLPLPAFIPKAGLDSSYAVTHPGWERYVGPQAEFRLFRASGRVQAVQVLSVSGAAVPESLVRSVLQEYAGSSDYKITSRKMKAGVQVANGTIRNKGDVVFYRKQGAIKAFVVSIN